MSVSGKINFIAILLPATLLISCSGNSSKEITAATDSIKKIDSLLNSANIVPEKFTYENEFDIVSNIEQIDFCVPVPKNNYVNDDKNVYEKAHIVLLHKKNKNDFIDIHGLFRSNKEIPINEYFKNTCEFAEQEGKIIEEKKLLKDRSIFYAKGYMNNKIYDERFIEIVWFRKEDVIAYTANFPIQDTSMWNVYLPKILSHSSFCEN